MIESDGTLSCSSLTYIKIGHKLRESMDSSSTPTQCTPVSSFRLRFSSRRLHLFGEARVGVGCLYLEDGWASNSLGVADRLALREDHVALAGDAIGHGTGHTGAADGGFVEESACGTSSDGWERAVSLACYGILSLEGDGVSGAEVVWVGLGEGQSGESLDWEYGVAGWAGNNEGSSQGVDLVEAERNIEGAWVWRLGSWSL